MTPQANEIIKEVAARHNLSVDAILSNCYLQSHTDARNEAYYRVRDRNPNVYSYPRLGAIFGRHHTTIMSGVVRHADVNGLPIPHRKPVSDEIDLGETNQTKSKAA